ncbi:hypothetical protein PASLES2_19950 [Pseudomonas aeruginosa]
MKRLFSASLLAAGLALGGAAHAAQPLLNVSYDVMRDFYKEYNPAFQKYWKAEKGENITIQMSHGGSSKQARSVIDGLPADVITMNQATDIDALADNGGLVPKDWATRLPNNSAPFTSATVFIVRKGNPKALKDWPDLLKDGVQVVVPNPKTSGNGRYTYLSAWGYVLKNGGDENKAKEFVGKLFKQVPVLDTGGRARHHYLHAEPDRRRTGDLRERSRDDRPRIRPRRLRGGLPERVRRGRASGGGGRQGGREERQPRPGRGLPEVPVVGRGPRPSPPTTTCARATRRSSPSSPTASRKSTSSRWRRPSATGAACRRPTSSTAAYSTRSTAPTDPSPLDEKAGSVSASGFFIRLAVQPLPPQRNSCSTSDQRLTRCPPASKNSISRRMPALSRQPGRSRTISSSR